MAWITVTMEINTYSPIDQLSIHSLTVLTSVAKNPLKMVKY